MRYVCDLTEQLSDTMIQILDRLDQAEDFTCPKFRLGPDEKPQSTFQQDPTVDYPERVRAEAKEAQRKANLTERQRLIEEAGITESDITPVHEQVIAHSESLRRASNNLAPYVIGTGDQSISRR